jgi:hypothetical protein
MVTFMPIPGKKNERLLNGDDGGKRLCLPYGESSVGDRLLG